MYLKLLIISVLIMTISGCGLLPAPKAKQVIEINNKRKTSYIDCQNVGKEQKRVLLAVMQGTSQTKKVIDIIEKFLENVYGKSKLKPSKIKVVEHYLNYDAAVQYCQNQYGSSATSMSAANAINSMINQCIRFNTGKTLRTYTTVGPNGKTGYHIKSKNPHIKFAYQIHLRYNNRESYYNIYLLDDGKNLLLYRTSSSDCFKYRWFTKQIKELFEKNNIKYLQIEEYTF